MCKNAKLERELGHLPQRQLEEACCHSKNWSIRRNFSNLILQHKRFTRVNLDIEL